MPDANGVPTHKEEIERKTWETLTLWVERVERRQCAPRDAEIALETLWGVSAGLVSRDAMDTLSDAIEACRAMSSDYAPRRVFVRDDEVLVLERREHPVQLRLAGGKEMTRDFSAAENPHAARREAEERLITVLLSKKMREIT